MIKTYNIKTIKNNNNSFSYSKSPNYSKILDDLIFSDIKEKNYYLKNDYKKSDDIIDNIIYSSKYSNLNKAIAYLKEYNKKKFTGTPYKLETIYHLSDGTPFMLFEDSIQIDDKLYFFDDLDGTILLPKLKETIITIYTNGLKISIIK